MTAPNIAIYEILNQMLQASERGDSAQAEQLLKKALDVDPENMEALRHAAGFYQIVMKDSAKARQYAALCRVQASAVTAQMDQILGQSGQGAKPPASRQIGGIIGPY
jgi:Tfp pilus assembly protein PilF